MVELERGGHGHDHLVDLRRRELVCYPVEEEPKDVLGHVLRSLQAWRSLGVGLLCANVVLRRGEDIDALTDRSRSLAHEVASFLAGEHLSIVAYGHHRWDQG
ncbi:hypothetical protein [Ornithinimicrobium kibberense]|uniref:hypothetical protein n=1 Tax=Ornithinimicrobium kibberense TaxID=282060 RepID=UPI00360DE1DF